MPSDSRAVAKELAESGSISLSCRLLKKKE